MDPSSRPSAETAAAAAPAEAAPRLVMLRPLKTRDFALLWSGTTVSLLGDGIYLVAIAWLVLRISNAPSALAIVGFAWTVPQVALLLWAGVASDRFDRRLVMVAADVVRGIAIAGVGALTLTGVIEMWHVIALVALYGAGDGLFMPAFSAIVPDVVPREQLVEANSLDQFVRPLALRFVGPAVGGLIIAVFGVGTAFIIDAGTFAVSAIAIRWMSATPRGGASERSAWSEIREGFGYVRRHAWLWVSLLATAIGSLAFYGPFQVLVPFVVKNRLGGDSTDLGLVFAVGGIGAVAASIVVGQRGLPRRHVTFTLACWALGTLALVGFATATGLWQAMVVSFVMEVLLTAGMIVWASLMQGYVPSHLLGRVSSVDWLMSSSLMPLSFAVTGPLAEGIGATSTLMYAGLFGACAISGFLFVPRLHDLEREGARLAG